MTASKHERIPVPGRLGETAGQLYAQMLTEEALKEAARPENIGVEVALLRVWLHEALRERGADGEIALQLFDRIVKAVAVKYRLGPRRAEDLAASLAAVAETVGDMFERDLEV